MAGRLLRADDGVGCLAQPTIPQESLSGPYGGGGTRPSYPSASVGCGGLALGVIIGCFIPGRYPIRLDGCPVYG